MKESPVPGVPRTSATVAVSSTDFVLNNFALLTSIMAQCIVECCSISRAKSHM